MVLCQQISERLIGKLLYTVAAIAGKQFKRPQRSALCRGTK
jgi:hypothetical protein